MTDVIEINEPGQLQDLIDTEDELVVKFTAPSFCAPCRKLAPHYVAAAEVSEATFTSVDLDHNEWGMVDYEVRSVPTVKLYRNGRYVKDLKERTALKLVNEIKES